MNRIVAVAGAAFLVSGLPASAQQDWVPWRMHEWMGWGSGWGGVVLGPLVMIAWLALLVVVVVWIVRRLGGAGASGAGPERAARDILDERYARGEIEREEYLRRRQDIDGR